MLHTYSKGLKADVVLLIVRLAVLAAVTLTVPVVLFPVSGEEACCGCGGGPLRFLMSLLLSVDPDLR